MRESTGLSDFAAVSSRNGGRLLRGDGSEDMLGGEEGSDKRPEVKSREYSWKGMLATEGVGVWDEGRETHGGLRFIYPTSDVKWWALI